VMMIPGTVYKIKIEMGVTSILFHKKHKIRLELASSSFPGYIRNLNTGEPFASGTRMEIARQTVYHSSKYPSRLIIPVIPGSRYDSARHPKP